MISKAVVVGIYQRKLEEIARLPDVTLTVIVPPLWRDPAGDVPLERAHTQGYDLRVVPMRFNGNFHLHYYADLASHFRDVKPDVVHIDEEPYNVATWQALWLAKRASAKSLFFTWQNIKRDYPFPFSAGEKIVMHGVDYALAGTESAAQVWRDKGYRGRMAVIPQFGVDPEQFHPPEARVQGRGLVVGYVGRLVPEKGVDLLIEALARVKTGGAWRLQIVGQGPERPALERLARSLDLSGRVTFTGAVPSARMADIYRELDVIVIPSRTLPNWKEQFGRVITEAMATGVAVIGSDSGAIPDIIGDAGLIFPEGNIDALADRLCTVLTDDALRTRLATVGRNHVLARYTHAQIASQTVAVYREMLG